MCKTCNGTGGTNIEHGEWGVSFNPCPDCDHEKEKERLRKYYEYRLAQLKGEIA